MNRKVKLLSLFACIFLVGCTPVQDMSLEEVIKIGTERTVEVYNKYRKGYKYNLPKGLEVYDNSEYNEVLMSSEYVYYLYVDAVSYYSKIIENYEVTEKPYVSMQINYQDKYGYLEINQLKNGKYFIEIMYNYAKIEVIVNKRDINEVVSNSLSILASVKFNDDVLKNLLDEETSQFKEFQFDIFETNTVTESEYLQAVEEEQVQEDEIHDTDLIN
jgi:hypothetical protein